MERADGIAKGPGDLFGWAAFDKISAQSLIDAVFGVTRFEEEAATFT